jgi:integrase
MVKLINAETRKYRIQFWFSGKCYRKIIRSGDKRLAVEIEARMRAELSQGLYCPERAKVTFEEIADRFLNEYACHTKSGKKMAIYLKRAKAFLAGKQAGAVTPEDIQCFRQELSLTLCQVSVNHFQKSIRRVYGWALDRKIFKGENPASSKRVKLTNERQFWRTRYLSADELKRLVDNADVKLKGLIICAAMTGLRKGELKNLKRKDVCLDKCQLFVRECKNDTPAYIPFPDIVFPILSEAVKACPDAESPVFDFLNLERRWHRARLTAGLGEVRFHDLRHTYASHLVQNCNGNMKVVQELLRHKDPRMTDRYVHLAESSLRQAALTLDTTFASLGAVGPQAPTVAPQPPNPAAMPIPTVQ